MIKATGSNAQQPNAQTVVNFSGELEWGKLSKVELVRRIFPADVAESYERPESMEGKLRLAGEASKKLVAGADQIEEDLEELLKALVEVVDGLKEQLGQKVDYLTRQFLDKHRHYCQGVDKLAQKASDLFKRIDSENSVALNRISHGDPLTRDIELMRAKRQAAQKAEETLLQVQAELTREKLPQQLAEFHKVCRGEARCYEAKAAEPVYRSLMKGFLDCLEAQPALKQNELVRDPFAPKQLALRPAEQPLQASALSQLFPGQPQPAQSVASQQAEAGALILQQNTALLDACARFAPQVALDRSISTSHTEDISCLCVLNKRYIATASCDRSIRLWDAVKNQAVLQLDTQSQLVVLMRKVQVDLSHPLGHLLVTVEQHHSNNNIAVYNLCTDSYDVPVLRSSEVSDQPVCLEVVSQRCIAVGYEKGLLCLYDVGSMNLLSSLDVGRRIDSLLVLPDRKTLVFTADNELFSCEVASSKVALKSRKRDTAAFSFLRCLGRTSEMFVGFLKNGLIRVYRAFDLESLHVILGQRIEYETGLVLNFRSEDPRVFLVAVSKFAPYFMYSDLDDSQLQPLPTANPLYTQAKGEHKIQLLDIEEGKSASFVTVGNVRGKQPVLWVWKMLYN